MVSNDVIMVGPALTPNSPSYNNVKGDVMAFDVRTGKKLWVFHTIPRKGEPGYETWLNGSADYTGNAGVWGPFSTDEELGYVYLNIEDATNDFYGGHRPGANLYSGFARLPRYQDRQNDLVPAARASRHLGLRHAAASDPARYQCRWHGRSRRSCRQESRRSPMFSTGQTDNRSGRCRRRPVTQTDVPGEWTSPTQPIPSKPPAFDVQGLKESDLIDFTPELRQAGD